MTFSITVTDRVRELDASERSALIRQIDFFRGCSESVEPLVRGAL